MEIPVKATRWKYHHTRKWHSQNLLFLEIHMSFSEIREGTVVHYACISLPSFTHSFSSRHSTKKIKNQHTVLMYVLKKNLFFLFQWNYHSLFRFWREERFFWEIYLNTFYFNLLLIDVYSVYIVMSFTDTLIQVCFDHIQSPRRSPSFPQTISPPYMRFVYLYKSRIHK